MKPYHIVFGLLGIGIWLVNSNLSYADEALEFFEQRIRPILAQECYECHSMATKQENDLALDTREGWLTGGLSGPAIEPGMPEASLLLRTIRHEEPGMHMPKAGAKLSQEILEDFEKWIAMGAVDPRDVPPTKEEVERAHDWSAIAERRKRWWSFQPVTHPAIPVSDGWSSHPVDRFLRAAQLSNSLIPNPDADPYTVLRRLHFVLTGLPANKSSSVAFLEHWHAVGAEQAIAHKVDELLASPHFGERWARHWMDWFRYAEGHGGQGDFEIASAFEYRDYLIRAFQQDVPYDQLIREHIAGDLLPAPRVNATEGIVESRIGPAHLRMVEHGFFPVDSLDELVKFTDNQIDVVSKAVLGLTVSCARCHNHKFDPISQRDYHALFGVFASSRPASVTINSPEPFLERKARLAKGRRKFISAIQGQWADEATPELVGLRLQEWLHAREENERFTKNVKAFEAKFANDPAAKQRELAKRKKLLQPAVSKTSAMHPWLVLRDKLDDPKNWEAYSSDIQRLQREARAKNERASSMHHRFADGLPEGWKVAAGSAQPVAAGELGLGVTAETAVASVLPSGLFSAINSSFEEAAIISSDFTIPDAATAVRFSGVGLAWIRLAPNNFPMANSANGIYGQNFVATDGISKWHNWNTSFWKGERGYFHVMTDRSASGRHAASANEDGTPGDDDEKVTRGSWWHLSELHQLKNPSDKIEATDLPVMPLLRDTLLPKNEEELVELYARTLRREIDAMVRGTLSDEGAEFLSDCLRAGLIRGKVADLREDVATALQTYRQLENELPATRVAPGLIDSDGFDQPLYLRGNHKQPSETVPRGFLTALGGKAWGVKEESGRLQLAEELTSSSNPLLARVIANRFWHHVFGVGLVKTTDNFGHTGDRPSHPELLDHLARHIEESGWSMKEMLRYLLTTRTFRTSSQPSREATDIDPSNRWLTHANIRRLEGEIIRDHLLAVSGSLDAKLFGPSIRQNAKTFRRSIYLRVDRTSQGPLLAVFDVPMPTTTRGARDISTTPAQAIALMNSPFVREQAVAWARKADTLSPRDAIADFFMQAVTRRPTLEELDQLVEFYETQAADSEHALADTAHLILNLKEFLFVK